MTHEWWHTDGGSSAAVYDDVTRDDGSTWRVQLVDGQVEYLYQTKPAPSGTGGSTSTSGITYGPEYQKDPPYGAWFQMGSNGIERKVRDATSLPSDPNASLASQLADWYAFNHQAGNPGWGLPSGVSSTAGLYAIIKAELDNPGTTSSGGIRGFIDRERINAQAFAAGGPAGVAKAQAPASSGPKITSSKFLPAPGGGQQLYLYYEDGTSKKAEGEGSFIPAGETPPSYSFRQTPGGGTVAINNADPKDTFQVVPDRPASPSSSGGSSGGGGGGGGGATSHTSTSTSKNYSFQDPAALRQQDEQFYAKLAADEGIQASDLELQRYIADRGFDYKDLELLFADRKLTSEEEARAAGLAESIRQFDIDNGLAVRTLDFQEANALANRLEAARQFDDTMGFDRETRTFNQGMTEKEFGLKEKEFGLSEQELAIRDRDSKAAIASRFQDAVSSTDPAAFRAFMEAGGGSIWNSLSQGNTAVSQNALAPAAQLLQLSGAQPGQQVPGTLGGPQAPPVPPGFQSGGQPAPNQGGFQGQWGVVPPQQQDPVFQEALNASASGGSAWTGNQPQNGNQPQEGTQVPRFAYGTQMPRYAFGTQEGFGNQQSAPNPATAPSVPQYAPTQQNNVPREFDNVAPLFPTQQPPVQQQGFTTAPQFMVGDAQATDPYRGGARPEIVQNPTQAPISVQPTGGTPGSYGPDGNVFGYRPPSMQPTAPQLFPNPGLQLAPPDPRARGRGDGFVQPPNFQQSPNANYGAGTGGSYRPPVNFQSSGDPYLDMVRQIRTNVDFPFYAPMNLGFHRQTPTLQDMSIRGMQSAFGIPAQDMGFAFNRWLPRGAQRGAVQTGY